MSPKLILALGPAGCGKSYHFDRVVNIDCKHIRLSADAIRFKMLDYLNTGINFDPKIEPQVWINFWTQFMTFLQVNQTKELTGSWIPDIYIDCTNLTQARRTPFIHVARSFGYTITIVWFHTSLFQCLLNNKKRERQVPEDVIARQFLALQAPEAWEYDELTEVN
jgi:hypothetical protein